MRPVVLVLLLAVLLAACGGRSLGAQVTVQPGELGSSPRSLPSQGIAVEVSRRLRPELILIGLDGHVLDRPRLHIDADSQLYRNILVLRSSRTGKRFVVGPSGQLAPYRHTGGDSPLLNWSRDKRCATFARRGGSTYRLCGDAPRDPTAMEVDGGGSRRLITGRPPHSRPPPTHIGFWRDAYLSPDGRTVLATWSVECEIPTAFFADSSRGLRPVTGEKDWRKSAESVGLGWTMGGLAVVQLFEGECGNGFSRPGIYLVDPQTGRHRLVYAVRGAFAVMWRR